MWFLASQSKKVLPMFLILFSGLFSIVLFQNCSSAVPVTFDKASLISAIPENILLESQPAIAEIGTRVVLQPTAYRNEKGLRNWEAYTYRWFHKGQILENQNSVQLVFQPFKIEDVGAYQLEITNEIDSVVSNTFYLAGAETAKALPESISITFSPSKAVKGGSATLILIENASKSWGDFEYEWLKSGSPLANANSRVLAINHLQETDGGLYQLKMIDPQDRSKNVLSIGLPLAILDPAKQLPEEIQIVANVNPAIEGSLVTLEAKFPKDSHLAPDTISGKIEDYYRFEWSCPGSRNCTNFASSIAVLDKLELADSGIYNLKVRLNSDLAQLKTGYPLNLVVKAAPTVAPAAPVVPTTTPVTAPTTTPITAPATCSGSPVGKWNSSSGCSDCTNAPASAYYTGYGGSTNTCAWDCPASTYIKRSDRCEPKVQCNLPKKRNDSTNTCYCENGATDDNCTPPTPTCSANNGQSCNFSTGNTVFKAGCPENYGCADFEGVYYGSTNCNYDNVSKISAHSAIEYKFENGRMQSRAYNTDYDTPWSDMGDTTSAYHCTYVGFAYYDSFKGSPDGQCHPTPDNTSSTRVIAGSGCGSNQPETVPGVYDCGGVCRRR